MRSTNHANVEGWYVKPLSPLRHSRQLCGCRAQTLIPFEAVLYLTQILHIPAAAVGVFGPTVNLRQA